MKISFDRKIKRVLANVVVGALLLLLCGCQESSVENWSTEEVQQLASEYLASRYSADFTILNCYTKANSPGPIPGGGVHWELRVQSDQFPDEIFFVYYKKRENEDWHFSDSYCRLLLQQEAKSYFYNKCKSYFEEDFTVDFFWGEEVWPAGTGEESTIQEFLQAGGHIWGLCIYLKDVDPTDDNYKVAAMKILESEPSVQLIKIFGLTNDGYSAAIESGAPKEIWNNHQEWRLGQAQYLPERVAE